MKKSILCTLCGGIAAYFCTSRERDYYDCATCRAILMDPGHYVSREEEKYRYETHNNDVEDPSYQQFVKPLVSAVRGNYDSNSTGLDYGAGTGPVATKLLEDAGYSVITYDPYFQPRPQAFRRQYDFIMASEVIEHFYQPAKEFRLLKSLLNTGGHLYCMTLRYHDEIDFKNWHYKNDETHVIFYRDETVRWIKKALGFSGFSMQERVFTLQK